MMLDLVPMWAAILALAVFMYVLLDGFDLGVGMVFLMRRDPVERQLMINSVAPVWDFNETWLILGGGGLLAVFPLAFAIIVPAVYFPILFMLLGLIFRGVAFEFREVVGARKWIWDSAFGYGSLVATFSQGVVLGMFMQGFPIHGRVFAGTSWDWFDLRLRAAGHDVARAQDRRRVAGMGARNGQESAVRRGRVYLVDQYLDAAEGRAYIGALVQFSG
jgi:cytochrome d ubiquinol oxidase subunit II